MTDIQYALHHNIAQILTKTHQYRQNHTTPDLHLLLGWAASIFSIAGSIYSFTHPFQDGIQILIVCCSLYFLLSGLIAVLNYYRGNIIYQGSHASGETAITASLTTDRYSDIATLTISKKDKAKKVQGEKIVFSVGACFDSDGMLDTSALEGIVAKALQSGDFKRS